jgi:hypothetical protein
LSNTAVAQIYPSRSSERPAEGWPSEQEEFYQPVITDSTLLFPSPSLVWQCVCGWPNEYEFYYDVDFRHVRKCWGRKEVFDRVEVSGVYSFVQRGLGRLHATLDETPDGFLYNEVVADSLDNATPTRTVQLVFDTDHVLRTDTSAIYQWNSEELTTRLTRYVELKPAR